jgi:transcriptional regulator with XRE-family HTH domain
MDFPTQEKLMLAMTTAKKKTRKQQGARTMSIGARIRELREQKGLSQGDIEKATGLLRCYTSRVENGHTIPSLETLERFSSALGVPLYQMFFRGEEPPPTPNLTPRKTLEDLAEAPGEEGANARFLLKLKGYVDRILEPDREVLLSLAKKLASH